MRSRIVDGNAAAPVAQTIQFAQSSYSVQEDGGSVTLTITRSAGDGTASVDWATADGTAQAGIDYTAASGTVNFADGETSKTVAVTILNDTIYRGTRTFDVNLSNASGATLGSPAAATVSILEDEQASGTATGETLLTKVNIVNESGANSPDGQVYTFASPVEPGAVPSGWHVELRHNGTAIPFQMDGECRQHPDGSLNFAVFTARLPEVLDGQSKFIELVSKEAAKPTGSVSDTPLTNAAFTAELDVGGVTYSAALNDALAAGDYDVARDGPVCKRYVAVRNLNDGTADHPDLWVRFYATAFVDGTVQVMAQFINGIVGDGTNYTVSAARLLEGATIVWSYDNAGAGWVFNHHSSFYTADGEGRPYWSQNKPVVYSQHDSGYFTRARAWWSYRDEATGIAAPSSPYAYTPGTIGNYRSSLNSAGDAQHIGYLPNWTTKALITQSSDWKNVDRANALAWTDIFIVFLNKSGRIPVLTPTDHTADGMEPEQSSVAWGNNSNIAEPRPDPDRWSSNGPKGSHNPEPAYIRMLEEGDEWLRDICILMANNAVGNSDETKTYPSLQSWWARTAPKTGGGRWYGLILAVEHRAWAWNLRALECAHWITPEMPERNYLTELRDNNLGWMQDLFENNLSTGGWATLGAIPWSSGGEHWNGSWQSSFLACSTLLAYWHDKNAGAKAAIDHHIVKQLFGQGKDGCPYGYGNYYVQMAPGGGALAQSWSEVVYLNGDPFIPAGGCPASGLAWGNGSAVNYSNVQMGAAGMAIRVAEDLGHPTLKEYAQFAWDYLNQEEAVTGPTDNEWADIPKYGAAPTFSTPWSTPTWLDSLAVNEVTQLSGTRISDIDPEDDPDVNPNYPDNAPWHAVQGLRAIIESWCGMWYDTKRHRCMIHGGGHGDYAGNEIYAIHLNTETPFAELWTEPSPDVSKPEGEEEGTYPDGLPGSTHTYDKLVYAPNIDKLVRTQHNMVYPERYGGSDIIWQYDPANLNPDKYQRALEGWSRIAEGFPIPGMQSPAGATYNSRDGCIYILRSGSFTDVYKFDPVAITFVNVYSASSSDIGSQGWGGYTELDCIPSYGGNGLLVAKGSSSGVVLLDLETFQAGRPTINDPDSLLSFRMDTPYDPVNNCLWTWAGGNVLGKIPVPANPFSDTWEVQSVNISGVASLPASPTPNGVYSRFAYDSIGGVGFIVYVHVWNENVYVVRVN